MFIPVNNSTYCYHFINRSDYDIFDRSIYSASTSIGAVSCLTAIVLILVAKAYKEFIYRLILYMAVAGFLSSLVLLLYRLGVDYDLKYEIAMTVMDLFTIYSIYIYSFLLFWIMLYLFTLTVFKVQLKKPKHEVIGLLTVLVTPLTFVWVYFGKFECKDNRSYKFDLFSNIPTALSILMSCVLIGAVLTTLCKSALKKNTLQQQHRKAVKETIPLVVFVIAHQVFYSLALGVLAYRLYMAEENKKASIIIWKLNDFWPVILVSLPVLLLSQPHIRHRMKCRRSPNLTTDNERATIMHQSSGVQQLSPHSYYDSIPQQS